MATFNDASLLEALRGINRQVNVRISEMPLTDILYPTILPVNNSYGEWSDVIPAIQYGPAFGEVKRATAYSKDVPLVELSVSGSEIKFDMFWNGYETNIEELGKAQAVALNIVERKAAAARRKYEEHVDTVAILGDPDAGWTGVANKPNITPIPASTKAAGGTQWVNVADGSLNATPQEIATDFINLIVGPASITRSLRPIAADTVLLPSHAYRALASNVTDVLMGGVTVLEFVRRQVAGATGTNFQIIELPELATAATTTIVGGGRAVAYRRSQDILELPVAAAYRFYDNYRDAPLGWMVPGWGRFGEVQIYEPRGARYMDGVQTAP